MREERQGCAGSGALLALTEDAQHGDRSPSPAAALPENPALGVPTLEEWPIAMGNEG